MKDFLIKLGKTVLLCLLCAIISLALVLPLWKWAVVSPKSYSAVIYLLIFALLGYFFYKQIKKFGFKKVIFTVIKSATLIVTLGLFVYLVLVEYRLIAFIVLAVGLTVFFLLCFLKPVKKLQSK